ncbi:unnamed protein product [Rotaria sp. Silwood2]|nr:unnamed protein product [Rotaria sp. Silwood2]CAF4798980.1 unnamed protein product [Rotaria sp. Silwood2]
MQQQHRLAHVLEIVQDLIALSILLAAESITFILDLMIQIINKLLMSKQQIYFYMGGLQLALPLITNLDLIQEIQTMSTATRPFIPSPTNALSLSAELF